MTKPNYVVISVGPDGYGFLVSSPCDKSTADYLVKNEQPKGYTAKVVTVQEAINQQHKIVGTERLRITKTGIAYRKIERPQKVK